MTRHPPHSGDRNEMGDLLRGLLELAHGPLSRTGESGFGSLPLEAREYFLENWLDAEPLVRRSDRLRVEPYPPTVPRLFRFEIDSPYKRRPLESTAIEWAPGPIVGTIRYRDNVLEERDSPGALVLLEDRAFFHPNHHRGAGFICPGDLPGGPYPLKALLLHVYAIVTYQNLSSEEPADAEAARYFATDPEALTGLEARPLYE